MMTISPLYDSYITCIWFLHHLYMMPISPVYDSYITCIWCLYHLYMMPISPVYDAYITCIWFLYHLYMMSISPVCYAYITCIWCLCCEGIWVQSRSRQSRSRTCTRRSGPSAGCGTLGPLLSGTPSRRTGVTVRNRSRNSQDSFVIMKSRNISKEQIKEQFENIYNFLLILDWQEQLDEQCNSRFITLLTTTNTTQLTIQNSIHYY